MQGDPNGDIEASETSSSESDLEPQQHGGVCVCVPRPVMICLCLPGVSAISAEVHRHYDTKNTGITEHPVESAEGYVFEENCWDVVVCFGHPAIGYGSSLLLLPLGREEQSRTMKFGKIIDPCLRCLVMLQVPSGTHHFHSAGVLLHGFHKLRRKPLRHFFAECPELLADRHGSQGKPGFLEAGSVFRNT